LVRRSPLVRLQRDERLIAMIREGQPWAFEALWDRYQGRLLAFCRHMLPSEQDAEDVLQDVFVSAHKAMLADNRQIKVKPWLYRIARNRCLNHLRRPVHEGSDEMMDEHPFNGGTTTAEQVQTRQELREVLVDVKHLPETQRTALLLREADVLSYAEIAQAMDTTIPAVKSLLVRARITLAESSQARHLTCGEVQVELAEAAEGIAKATGPVRQHVKACEQCKDFRDELRSSSKALAALFPLGPLALLKDAVLAKLGGAGAGSASTGGGAGASGAAASGACGAGAGAAAGGAGASGMAAGGAIGGAAAAGGGAGGIGGGIGLIGGAIGTKAAAGVATAAIAVAGAVEVKRYVGGDSPERRAIAERTAPQQEPAREPMTVAASTTAPVEREAKPDPEPVAPAPSEAPADASPAEPAPAEGTAGAGEPAPAEEDSPPSGHEGGVVTAIGTHEGPVTTTPAPSGSASGSSTESESPPPSNSSPPPEQEPEQGPPVVEVVPVAG
jgi:RNA polymerase sigma factor (sigma-70 family)